MKYFPFLMLFLLLGSNIYVFYRYWQLIPLSSATARVIFIITGIILASSFLVSFFLRNSLPPILISSLYKIGTSWLTALLYLFILFLASDLLRLTSLPVQNLIFHSWTGTGIITGILILLLSGGYLKYRYKEKVELNLSTVKEKLDTPLKILAVSDLHLGYSIEKKELAKWVRLINSEKPDIILIAGDIIDNNTHPLREQDMASELRKLNAKYGIYAVPGNHEYISGITESIAFLRDAGIQVLKDSSILINNQVYVTGRDDRMNRRRKSLDKLTESLDSSKTIILLDHQPYDLDITERNNIDLQFSGHTHRGQIWPISWLTDKIYEKSHGYLQKGNTHIYVSSGLGIWGGKFRIGSQSEYVIINLQ